MEGWGGWVGARFIPASRGIRVEPRWKSWPAARVVGRKRRGPGARAAAAEARVSKTAALEGPAARCVLGGWTSLRLISMSRRRGRGPRAAPALRADACPEAVGAVTLTRGIGQRTECGPSDYESDHESGRRIAGCRRSGGREDGRACGKPDAAQRRSPTRR